MVFVKLVVDGKQLGDHVVVVDGDGYHMGATTAEFLEYLKPAAGQTIDVAITAEPNGEWQGKAGGYAIQGKAAAFITEINGSYTNVVGLCLPTTVKLLAEFR